MQRRVGTAGAVVLGLGAMLGAGVFTAFSPAAAAAGKWLIVALALAAVVATCNAWSSAELAARYPRSGGSYVYAGELLGRWPARVTGVAFLAGKTSSAAAAAGTLGVYLWPEHPLPVALAAIAVTTGVNVLGVRKTVTVTAVLVAAVLAVLAIVVVSGLTTGEGWFGYTPAEPVTAGPAGVLTAAGLLFFAFAGYARMATLGEEVRDPRRTLRLAIPLALGLTLLVYAAVAAALLRGLGVGRLAAEAAPLRAVVPAGLGVVVQLGAAVAVLSALLSVLVGVSRTTLAMARNGDLPPALARLSGRDTPWRADLAGAVAAALIAVLAGPAAAIALSACCVLAYYASTNLAALRLPGGVRRVTAWLGLVLCVVLAVALPWRQVLVTVVVLVAGTCLTAALARYGRAP